ncbi:AAEL006225-PA [Aedes aegypti]|uniref:AAEL006225-PA n=1 Tax=Aedes aegypti TaxID=7159 RepID=Q176Y3_AEDAE|nr:AAEL006225-PA [Aedes aegypti]
MMRAIFLTLCSSICSGFPIELENRADLILNYKNLTEFDVSSATLTEVIYLSLQGNNLITFPRYIYHNLPEVERIKLTDNPRITFPSDGSPFLISWSLIELELESCGIQEIYNGSLSCLSKMEEINMGSNLIKQIDKNAFRENHNLRKIVLSNNNLATVPINMLKGLERMKEIDLSYNRNLAARLNRPFLMSNTLEILKCSYCGFRETTEITFAYLPNLRELRLEGNLLLRVPVLLMPNIVVIGKDPDSVMTNCRILASRVSKDHMMNDEFICALLFL